MSRPAHLTAGNPAELSGTASRIAAAIARITAPPSTAELVAAAKLGPLTRAERRRYAYLAASAAAGYITATERAEYERFEVRDEHGLADRYAAARARWDALAASVTECAA